MRPRIASALVAIGLVSCSGGSEPTTSPAPKAAPPGTIAFMRGGGDGAFDLYLMNVDGSNQRNITNTPEFEDLYPSLSPDRTRVAFVGDYNGDYDIFLTDAQGVGRLNLTNDPANDSSPAWSPDGTLIAYSSEADIWVMHPDGSGKRQLTRGGAQDDYPSWNADGSKILFSSGRGGSGTYEVPVDGGKSRRVSDGLGVLSPEGTTLARIVREPPEPGKILIGDADGKNASPLLPGPDHDIALTWSPDGSMLAITNDRDGDYEIYVVRPDGTGLRQLTDNAHDDFATSWR